MAKSKQEMIQSFGREVEAAAGPGIGSQVMAGAEALTARSGPGEVALWVKGAIDRLDRLAPEGTRVGIMEACGTNCTRVNYTAIARGKARRARFGCENDFLAAEVRKPQAGTRLEWNGNELVQTYVPQEFTHPLRCYCGLLRGLPEGVQVSPTYCNCSKAFVRTFWSEVLGRPVRVELLESAVSGSTVCRFRIEI
jgi:hypothetical protein